MKLTAYFVVLLTLFMASCDKPIEKPEPTVVIPSTNLTNSERKSSSNDHLLKDVPKEYQKLFVNNFKQSCVEAAVNEAGEEARALMERICTCGADKALEIVTLKDAMKIELGDKQVEQRVMKSILGQMSDCIVSQ